jgi:C-terminal processing protease CtpA/Prc
MKTKSLKTVLLSATAAFVIGMMSAHAAPSASPSPALPPDLQVMYDKLPPPLQARFAHAPHEELIQTLRTMQFFIGTNNTVNDPVKLKAAFSSKARSLFDKLSPADQAKAIPDIQQDVKDTLSDQRVQRQFASIPSAEQPELLAALISEAAYERADQPNNYCNVMLDMEGAHAYSDEGVKKLAAVARQCPTGPKVDLDATLAYVNKTLACAVGDPNYTRIMAPKEYSDMREESAGTKTAFAGGGIGLKLSPDLTTKLPPTAEQLAEFAKFVQLRKDALEHPEVDACTGLPTKLTAEEEANLKKPLDQPFAAAFSGLVYHVVKGGPADLAGIMDGDVVTKVNGQVVTGLESNSVIDKMRGPLGTQVTITVERNGTEITKTLTRAAVLPDNVWSRDLGNGIYAIVISDFARDNTSFEVYDEVMKIGDKARGYVFDVRNNPGGLLDEAIKTVSWFVHDGVIVSQRERIEGDPAHPNYLKITWSRVGDHVIQTTVEEATGKVQGGIMTLSQTDDKTGKVVRQFKEIPFLGDKPMVVLANGSSASAAEIFTGGMSENRVLPGEPSGNKPQGATFIGTHTYGKFIGQTVMPGPLETGVKATSFRYFSPKGEWLGDAWKVKIGLTPSIKVDEPDTAVPFTPADAQLNASKDYLIGVLDGSKATTQTH